MMAYSMKFLALFLLFAVLLTAACRRSMESSIVIAGVAQGTTYHITYLAGPYSNYRESIDSLFKVIDASLSTYQPNSLVSRINNNDSSVVVDDHFEKVFTKAVEVAEKTGGLFDITVGPLINAYGFGPTRKIKLGEAETDSLQKLTGYRKLSLANKRLVKSAPGMKLDFNAIAQGYTVDVLATFLESKGINDYLIELGGEVRAKGKKQDGNAWTLGIEQPDEDQSDGAALQTTIGLNDQSLATSGNYKKFYVENGKKFTHIINPLTGLATKNDLLSVTVAGEDCMTADAYATSFIVMGFEAAKAFIEKNRELNLEALFIYDKDGITKIYRTEKFPSPVQ